MNNHQHKTLLKWNKTSLVILSSFFVIIFLIGYIWWPLLKDYMASYNAKIPFWLQIDWLLILIFLFMSIMIMLNADLRRDIPMAAIALAGGFVIEFWGTRTGLWQYYTGEQPPLWIIPAWPIAFLTLNRLVIILTKLIKFSKEVWILPFYWLIFTGFFAYFLYYVFPTISNILTLLALLLCAIIIIINPDKKLSILYFIAGSGLGYFLELWGTTRECWTYYSGEYPPLFTVFAHGFAVVAIFYFYNVYIRIKTKVISSSGK